MRVLEAELELAREELLRANEEGTTSEQLDALARESRLLRDRVRTLSMVEDRVLNIVYCKGQSKNILLFLIAFIVS